MRSDQRGRGGLADADQVSSDREATRLFAYAIDEWDFLVHHQNQVGTARQVLPPRR
jgi:hypothetical protein